MKTIKRERQVRLDELLKYVWDNDLTDCKFYDESEEPIFITGTNSSLKNTDYVGKNDLFKITEEVEITEDTPLQRAMVIKNRKINSLKTMNIKFIYLQNEDGSIGDLIWSKERGLID